MNRYKIARDGYGVCMKCWRLTTTVIMDKWGGYGQFNDIDPEYIQPVEVTACCLSEDMIPIQYAGKCNTCGEWLDIRFAYSRGMEEYCCEKCEAKEA